MMLRCPIPVLLALALVSSLRAADRPNIDNYDAADRVKAIEISHQFRELREASLSRGKK